MGDNCRRRIFHSGIILFRDEIIRADDGQFAERRIIPFIQLRYPVHIGNAVEAVVEHIAFVFGFIFRSFVGRVLNRSASFFVIFLAAVVTRGCKKQTGTHSDRQKD